jgi:hypothetical protein
MAMEKVFSMITFKKLGFRILKPYPIQAKAIT